MVVTQRIHTFRLLQVSYSAMTYITLRKNRKDCYPHYLCLRMMRHSMQTNALTSQAHRCPLCSFLIQLLNGSLFKKHLTVKTVYMNKILKNPRAKTDIANLKQLALRDSVSNVMRKKAADLSLVFTRVRRIV